MPDAKHAGRSTHPADESRLTFTTDLNEAVRLVFLARRVVGQIYVVTVTGVVGSERTSIRLLYRGSDPIDWATSAVMENLIAALSWRGGGSHA